MSESAFKPRSFLTEIVSVVYVVIGFVSFLVSGGIAIYHESFHDLVRSPLHIVAWPILWANNVAGWSHFHQMILVWIACGVYLGIGLCSCVVTAIGSILGNSVASLVLSPLDIVAWPLLWWGRHRGWWNPR